MGPLEITGTPRLVLGLVTGIAFGFILQKGQALKFHKIIDALRLRDFTIWKLIFTAIGVGMIGIYGMNGLGWQISRSSRRSSPPTCSAA